MNIEKYTERAKGFVQAAQTLAQRRGHQQITPDHLLKVLIDDKEGLCSNLIRAAGGEPKSVSAAVDAALDKLPKVEGGSGQKTRWLLEALASTLSGDADHVSPSAHHRRRDRTSHGTRGLRSRIRSACCVRRRPDARGMVPLHLPSSDPFAR